MNITTQHPRIALKKHSHNDPRLSNILELFKPGQVPSKESWVCAGYPDDEGIEANGGRLGAKQAPNKIREFLYNMTPDFNFQSLPSICDLGNLDFANCSLSEKHLLGSQLSEFYLRSGHRWMAFGGGHDFGYSEGSSFLKTFKGQRPLVINLDAHFDVRESDRPHSGTPFRRLLEEFDNFQLLAIGMQNQCNSREHSQYLKHKGAKVLGFDEITLCGNSPAVQICEFLVPELIQKRPIFLSIDLDVFSSAVAPGCSQSWPIGLEPLDLIPMIDLVCQRGDLRSVGFYEVSPPLDVDDRTSKLAAQLAHRIIFQTGQK